MEEDVFVQEPVFAYDWRALLGVSAKTLLDGINSCNIDIVWEIDFGTWIDNRLKFLDEVKLSKRRFPIHHLIENASEGPNIGGL